MIMKTRKLFFQNFVIRCTSQSVSTIFEYEDNKNHDEIQTTDCEKNLLISIITRYGHVESILHKYTKVVASDLASSRRYIEINHVITWLQFNNFFLLFITSTIIYNTLVTFTQFRTGALSFL